MGIITIKMFRATGKKSFSFVPTACTLINALFGFLAVVKAFEGEFVSAAYYIFCAACMDLLDGRIARFFGWASALGSELDSLCDAVSFCCVPVIVMYCWCLHTQGTVGLTLLAFYLWCGLFRLARFNIIAAGDAKYFIGLPTTGAALCVAGLLIWMPTSDTALVHCGISMLIILILALLMISTIRFPTGKRMPSGVHLRLSMIIALGIMTAAFCCSWPLLLVIPVSYIVISSFFDMYLRMDDRRKRC